MNLFSLAKAFPTEEHALAYWVKARWPHGVRCVACNHGKCYLIETKGKTGKIARRFECAECKHHFTATSGTLFHDSHVPLQKWFMAVALMAEGKKGISAAQVARHIGVTYKTAWFMCHRIRDAMSEGKDVVLGGAFKRVEVDETYVGGKTRGIGVKAGRNAKTIVLGIAERKGKVHMEVIPDRKASSIRAVVNERVSEDTFKVHTDQHYAYGNVIPKDQHAPGLHKEELKRGNKTSTQTVEGAFSLFKRGIVGSYHWLSEEHLNRYLGEFCWRYNRRGMQPWMFDMVLDNMAKAGPLPYAVLTWDEPF